MSRQIQIPHQNHVASGTKYTWYTQVPAILYKEEHEKRLKISSSGNDNFNQKNIYIGPHTSLRSMDTEPYTTQL